jgi:hypothetical protein
MRRKVELRFIPAKGYILVETDKTDLSCRGTVVSTYHKQTWTDKEIKYLLNTEVVWVPGTYLTTVELDEMDCPIVSEPLDKEKRYCLVAEKDIIGYREIAPEGEWDKHKEMFKK